MKTVSKVYFSPHASFITLEVGRILATDISIHELLLSSPATELSKQRKGDLPAQSV